MSLVQKLKLKPEQPVWLLQCPENLLPVFNGMDIKEQIAGKDMVGQLVFFALNKKQLDKTFPKITRSLTDDATCWIAYPKKSSGIVSDLIRDEGWEIITSSGYQFVTSISVDDYWSGMRVRKRDPNMQYKRDIPMEERKTPDIDYVNRTVALPPDALKSMKPFKGLDIFFQNMSFSHKREYVEAIEEAKKPETRQRRIDKMIEMLLQMKEQKEAKQKI